MNSTHRAYPQKSSLLESKALVFAWSVFGEATPTVFFVLATGLGVSLPAADTECD